MRDTQREAEGEAGSTQGAQCGTRSWVSKIRPWAEGRCQTAEPPRDPTMLFLCGCFLFSLVTNDVKHPFVCLLAICIIFFGEMSIQIS